MRKTSLITASVKEQFPLMIEKSCMFECFQTSGTHDLICFPGYDLTRSSGRYSDIMQFGFPKICAAASTMYAATP